MSLRSELEKFPFMTVSRKIKKANSLIPRNLQWVLYIAALLLSDALMTFFAFWLAYNFRFVTFVEYFDQTASVSFATYSFLLYSMPFLWLAIFSVNGLYARDNLLGGTQEYSKLFRSASEGFLLIVIAGFLGPSLVIARGWLLMAWMFTFIFSAFARFWLRRLVYALRKQGFFLTPAVIVGANQEGRWLAEQLLKWETSGLHLVGFVDKKTPATFPLFHDLVSLGTVEQLGEIIERYNIGEVILASSAISTRDYLLEIFRKYGISDKVNIRMSSGLYEILTTGLTVNEFAYVPLVYVNKVRLTGSDTILKFLLDYVLTLGSLLVLLPLLLVLAILVKLSSPGPIIHKRRVMGLNGKQFYAYKFRTMVVNGDEVLAKYPELQEELAHNHKLKNDPRVTRIGAFMRKYSLDELPQLFNVLKREMSLVGPRMISPEEVAMYKQFDMNLLTVLPGLTGVWQVSGRSDVSYEERVRLDMYYIRNWSIWLDLQLLFQTIPAVLKSRGAY
ncbi:MAG: sugar transferase [Chloroflexi bacterium]|nr:sugar transferase [Chloroflexota bacterium]